MPTSLHLYTLIYTLSISVEPDGSGVVTLDRLGGIEVTLVAVSSPRYVFHHWNGDSFGTEPTASITIGEDMSVTAHFKVASQNC